MRDVAEMTEAELRTEVQQLRRRNAELADDAATLARLEAAGVDNWEGYSNAMSDS